MTTVADVTFLLLDAQRQVTGIALLALAEADNVAIVVQGLQGWELWTAETVAGRGVYWQDRDQNLRGIEELLHEWCTSDLRPKVQYADDAAPIIMPDHEQLATLVTERTCPFSFPEDSMRMSEWLASQTPFLNNNSEELVAVTAASFTALRGAVAAQTRACLVCDGRPLCQQQHRMCPEHFASYVIEHTKLVNAAPTYLAKQLPQCVDCGAPLCIDMLFNVAANSTLEKEMSDRLFDAVVDLAATVRAS